MNLGNVTSRVVRRTSRLLMLSAKIRQEYKTLLLSFILQGSDKQMETSSESLLFDRVSFQLNSSNNRRFY
jgi:hypothetical protein